MGLADRAINRVKGWRSPGPTPLEQAGRGPAWTPLPVVDEYGDTEAAPNTGLLTLVQPGPEWINYAFLHCDEYSRVIVRIRTEVWRRGLVVESRNDWYCTPCGKGTDDPREGCPHCGATMEQLQPPDDAQRQRIEAFLGNANRDGESLDDVGSRFTEEMLKHGRGIFVYKYGYTFREVDGAVDARTLRGVQVGDPGRFARLKDRRRQLGGRWLCLYCRSNHRGYKPMDKQGPCEHCGGVTYEARYVEFDAPQGSTERAWYTGDEVAEVRWPYKDGSSPTTRVWRKIVFFIWSDRYAANAVAPRTDFPPEKLLITEGGDEGSVRAWMKKDYEDRKKQRRRYAWLHLQGAPVGMDSLKQRANVLDLSDTVFREQSLELRRQFAEDISNQYHLSPMQAGNTEARGGLNNDKLDLRSTAQVAEDIQRHIATALQRVGDALGAPQWTITFPPALEEDETRRADAMLKWLDVADKAESLGLEVEWEDGEARVSDGPVEKKQPPLVLGEEGDAPPNSQAGKAPPPMPADKPDP